MKIDKIGHCCLLIEDEGVRMLTDPGMFTTAQNELKGIDAVLVSHEHYDHIHIDSVKAILDKNPSARILTNTAVGKLMDGAGIGYELIGDGESTKIGDVSITSVEGPHAAIHRTITPVLNTGFVINDRLFYPGDAFLNPFWPVEILALPVAGPWLKINEVIEYAVKLKVKKCFPVHDAVLAKPSMFHGMIQRLLEAEGIEFVALDNGQSAEF